MVVLSWRMGRKSRPEEEKRKLCNTKGGLQQKIKQIIAELKQTIQTCNYRTCAYVQCDAREEDDIVKAGRYPAGKKNKTHKLAFRRYNQNQAGRTVTTVSPKRRNNTQFPPGTRLEENEQAATKFTSESISRKEREWPKQPREGEIPPSGRRRQMQI